MELVINTPLSPGDHRAVRRAFDQLMSSDNYPCQPKHYERLKKLASSPALVNCLCDTLSAQTDPTAFFNAMGVMYTVGVLLAEGSERSRQVVAQRLELDIAACVPFDLKAWNARANADFIDDEGARGPMILVLTGYRRLLMALCPQNAEPMLSRARDAWRALAEPTRAYQLVRLAGVEPPSDSDWLLEVLPRDDRADACIEAWYSSFFSVRTFVNRRDVATMNGTELPATTIENLPTLRTDLIAWALSYKVKWKWEMPWKAGVNLGAIVKTSGFNAADRKKLTDYWRKG